MRNDNGSNNGVGDSLSWAELSSISSAFISTKSEPPPPSHRNHSQQAVAAAQRDYRLQSYKCPENFVLPDLHSTTTATKDAEQKSNCDSTAASIITSAAGSKKKQKHNAHGQLLPETTVKVLDRATSTELNHGTNSNKWLSAVGDELQSNRLFVSVFRPIFWRSILFLHFIHSLHLWASFPRAQSLVSFLCSRFDSAD